MQESDQYKSLLYRVAVLLERGVWRHEPRIPSLHAGFGRIGRLVLRATLNRKDVNVVAINGKFFRGLQTPCSCFS
jgi:hypothetical protein